MKRGWILEGKTVNVDLILKHAKTNTMSPEEASAKMGMARNYLRNRKNENKKGIYREACTDVVENAMKAFGLSFEELVIDLPKRCI